MLHTADIPLPTFVDDDPGHIAHVKASAPQVKIMSTAAFKEFAAAHPALALDTETTGLDRQRDQVVFWSAATADERFCFRHTTLADMAPIIEDPDKELVFINRNFDAWMFLNSGVDLANGGRTNFRSWDVGTMHTLFADNQDHDLKHISKTLLGIHMPSFREVFNAPDKETGRKLREAYDTDPWRVIDYASKDAWATFRNRDILAEKLSQLDTHATLPGMPKTLLDYYFRFEQPLHDVLWQMERTGIRLDALGCDKRLDLLDALIAEQKKVLAGLCGKVGFNPNSDDQVRKILFTESAGIWKNEFGEIVTFMTAGGESGNKKPSVKADPVLLYLAKKGSKFAAALVRHNKLDTTRNYLLGYKKSASFDGVMHTTFNQSVAATGRLSSSGPNLQNVKRPGETDEFEIRGVFIAPEDHTVSDSDYSQLEICIVADLANETVLIAAIQAGRDVHCWTAFLMFGDPYETFIAAVAAKDAHQELTAGQRALLSKRTAAKTINFMIIYGGSEYKLASTLGVPVPDAKKMINAYWTAYPNIKRYMSQVERHMEDYWWVATLCGRRRQIPQASLKNTSWKDYNAGKREAGNHGVQGTGAEVVKGFQIRLFLDDEMWDAGYRQSLQVHDEVVGLLPHELAKDQDFINRYEHYAAQPFGDYDPLKVPLKSKFGSGKSWLEAK